MILRRFLPLLLLLLVRCSKKEVKVAFRDMVDAFSFTGNTRLIITLGNPHSKHLMVYSPEGHIYYFLNPADESEEIQFEKELLIDPLTFKGIRYDENTGEPVEEMVFTKPGKYRLYFAHNTETESENTFYLEKMITYK